MSVPFSVPLAVPVAERDRNDPVTLYRVMQNMIGDRLKARYTPPKKLSHELFVLMLQLKDREQREKKSDARKAKPRKTKSQKAAQRAAQRTVVVPA